MMPRKSKVVAPVFLGRITARAIERCSGPAESQTVKPAKPKDVRLDKRFTRYTFTYFGSRLFWVKMLVFRIEQSPYQCKRVMVFGNFLVTVMKS
jgi:hypothetical protein